MAGVPDDLDRLWTPQRMAYVTGKDRPATGYDVPAGCPFCLAPRRPAEEGLVVARGHAVFAVLNLYPYNPGHLMVCPFRHVADYTELDEAETMELARFVQDAMQVLRDVSSPHGFNLGLNQGQVAGAGIAAHLHMHVVPRWGGDTNFMPVIGRTKVLPQLLTDTRDVLATAWDGIGRPARPGPAAEPETGRRAGDKTGRRGPVAGRAESAQRVGGRRAARPSAAGTAVDQAAAGTPGRRSPKRAPKRASDSTAAP